MEHISEDPIEIARKIAAQEKRNKEKALKKEAKDFHVSKTSKEKVKEEKSSEARKHKEKIENLLEDIKKTIEQQKEVKNSVRKTISDLEKEGLGGVLKNRESVRKIFNDPMKEYDTLRKTKKKSKIVHQQTEHELNPKIQEIEKEIEELESQINQESEFFKKSEAEPFLNEVVIREELKKEFIDARRSINISEFASPEKGFYQALTVVNELENIAKEKRIDSSFIPETAREILHEKIETFIEAEKAKTSFDRRKEGVENLGELNKSYEEYTKQINDSLRKRHDVFEELKPILEKNPHIQGAISEYGIKIRLDNPERQEEFLQYFATQGSSEYDPEKIKQTINIYNNGGVSRFIQNGKLPIVEKNLKQYIDTLNKSIEKIRELVIFFAEYKGKGVRGEIEESLDKIHKELYKNYYITHVDGIDPTVLDFMRQKAGGDSHRARQLIRDEEAVYQAKKLDLETKADAFVDKAVAMNKERALVSGSSLKFQKEQFEKKKKDVKEFQKVLEDIRKQHSEHLDQPLNSYMRFYEDDINIKNWSEQIELLDKKEKQIDLELNTLIQRGEPSFFGVEKYKNKKEGLETKKQTTEQEIKEIIKKREEAKRRSKDIEYILARFNDADFKKEFDKKMGFYDLYSNTPGPTLREYVNEGDKYVRGILEEPFGAEKEQVLYALQDAEERIKTLYTPKN